MSARDNIPPLTVAWLHEHGACVGGKSRFNFAVPTGSLQMDKSAVEVLAEGCYASDMRWLLRKMLGQDNMHEIDDAADAPDVGYFEYKRRLAAACVAAWWEYHR